MNKRIEDHVNALFANTGNESHILDIKEELLSNLNEKYNDLIASGKNEDEAYALVISGIGDIDNLLNEIRQSPQYQPLEITKNQEKRSVFISIGIALYILSIAPILLFSQTGYPNLGVVFLILICAVATGLVAYGNSLGKSNYVRTDNSFVEEYKEKVSDENNRRKLKSAITSSMWSMVIVLYFSLSSFTGRWSITWIIFLVGFCIQQIIQFAFADADKRSKLWHAILWISTVIVYFIISFGLRAWHWSWMVFLIAVAIEQIIRMLILWREAV